MVDIVEYVGESLPTVADVLAGLAGKSWNGVKGGDLIRPDFSQIIECYAYAVHEYAGLWGAVKNSKIYKILKIEVFSGNLLKISTSRSNLRSRKNVDMIILCGEQHKIGPIFTRKRLAF